MSSTTRARTREIIARAFVEAQTPTPGPVVVVLPEDMLEDRIDAGVVEPLAVPRAGLPSLRISMRSWPVWPSRSGPC